MKLIFAYIYCTDTIITIGMIDFAVFIIIMVILLDSERIADTVSLSLPPVKVRSVLRGLRGIPHRGVLRGIPHRGVPLYSLYSVCTT
jgi:hypothetical protein